MLFEFESVGETKWALNFSQRSFKSLVLHLVNWNQSIGCSESADLGREAWVRVFGLQIHLWSCNILKKIGDGCGGFIELEEESFSALVLSWATILVRVNSRRLPQSIEVEDGFCSSLHLWWEIPPCVGKLKGVRVSSKCAETEVRDDLHDVSCMTERVARGGRQRYKAFVKDFKSLLGYGKCCSKRPLNFVD